MNFYCNHACLWLSALLKPRVDDNSGMMIWLFARFISPATCFQTHARKGFMGRLFIIYRTTSHFSGLEKLLFTSLTHFCSLGWACSSMNIWRRCRQIKVRTFPLKCMICTLVTRNCSKLLIFLVLVILLFYCGALLFPTKELVAAATHHYLPWALVSKFHEIVFFFLGFPEGADGRPCWHGFFQLVQYQKLRAWGLRTLVKFCLRKIPHRTNLLASILRI